MRLPSIDLAENRGDSLCVAEKGRLGDLSVIVHGALFRMPPMHHRLIFLAQSHNILESESDWRTTRASIWAGKLTGFQNFLETFWPMLQGIPSA